MSDTSTMSGTSLRAWLLSDTPASRRQAGWGRLYRLWRDLRADVLYRRMEPGVR